jgi:hypothetical protein
VKAIAGVRSSTGSRASGRAQPPAGRSGLPAGVRHVAKRIARSERLVVACDHGAILAARADRHLRALARLTATRAAIATLHQDSVPAVTFQVLGSTVIGVPDAEIGSALGVLRAVTGTTASVFIRYQAGAHGSSEPSAPDDKIAVSSGLQPCRPHQGREADGPIRSGTEGATSMTRWARLNWPCCKTCSSRRPRSPTGWRTSLQAGPTGSTATAPSTRNSHGCSWKRVTNS